MDSKDVSKEIRRVVRPMLKDAGFTKFTSRSAWRYHKDRIDVINFQSFNSYNAYIMDVTTFSFAVNFGCLLCVVPKGYSVKEQNGFPVPDEASCQFRGELIKTIKQDPGLHEAVWYVNEDGANLEESVSDACEQLKAVALPWFEKLNAWNDILDILCNYEWPGDFLELGFGTKSSPCRSYITGCVAFYLGQKTLAKEKLQEAVDSGCYTELFSNVAEAIKLIKEKCK